MDGGDSPKNLLERRYLFRAEEDTSGYLIAMPIFPLGQIGRIVKLQTSQ